jgi:ATP-binding cassette subfamily B protein
MRMRIFAADTSVQLLFVWANAIIIGIGAWVAAGAVRSGASSVGDFVLFVTAITILQSKLATTMQLSSSVANSVMLVGDYLSTIGDRRGAPKGAEVPPRDGALVFHDVWFRYSENAPWVLQGVSFQVGENERVAIVGVNGSGKSTVAALALRLIEPTSGRITWGGRDVRSLDPELYRALIATVFQDFVQFEMTAAENVVLEPATADQHDVLDHYARQLGLEAVVDALGERWSTLLSTQRQFEDGYAGVDMSGGQRQRFAILRAMWHRSASMVVLDEATAALDVLAERNVIETIDQHFAGASMLIITHRPAPARLADRVLALDRGLLREVWAGTPGGFTLDLYEEVAATWEPERAR